MGSRDSALVSWSWVGADDRYLMNSYAAGTPLPQTPQSQALLAPLDDAFRRALAGDQSPQQALDDVAAAYRKTFPDYTSNLP